MASFRVMSDKWRGFFTGHSGERQVLLGFHLPGLIALFFNAQGTLTDVQTVAFSDELLREWDNPPYDARDPNKAIRVKGLAELRNLQQDIDFVEGAILVQPFTLKPVHNVYLTELPEEYRDAVDDPEQFDDEEELADAFDHIRKWKEAGMFALGWDVEYFMNRDGTINTI
jgi:hypothetical protein